LSTPQTDRSPPAAQALSPRKAAIHAHAERVASERKGWIARSRFFYDEDNRYMRFLVPEDAAVLELGCGSCELLQALMPRRGVGVDLSEQMIARARDTSRGLEFVVGDVEDPSTLADLTGPFDFIIVSDTVGDFEDVEATFASIHPLCTSDTRVVIAYYSPLWAPILKLAQNLGLKMPTLEKNWLWIEDIAALLKLADFEIVRSEFRILCPKSLFGIGRLVNRYIATLPLIRRLCLRNYVVARSLQHCRPAHQSVSVVIPARNERGNIEAAVQRIPLFAEDIEIIFVEGHSKDGTLDEMFRVQAAYPGRDIKVMVQEGKGKADAVWKGFDAARGDVLMILDADLTMPPEALPKFWRAIQSGKGEFVNGSRLVYPLESGAMQFLNYLANHAFSLIFSFLLNQRFTDTLCGTKVMSRRHYERLKRQRAYFGDFDPFGDFDLIFGAVKQHLKVVEIPIRYASRSYGTTQISRFRHGVLLLRMVLFAYRKLKAL
jgi:SAM-dependent methyltransferase